MGVLAKSQIDLECPSCRKTGVVTLMVDDERGYRSPSVPVGFFLRLADASMQVICADCDVTAYEVRYPTQSPSGENEQ